MDLLIRRKKLIIIISVYKLNWKFEGLLDVWMGWPVLDVVAAMLIFGVVLLIY